MAFIVLPLRAAHSLSAQGFGPSPLALSLDAVHRRPPPVLPLHTTPCVLRRSCRRCSSQTVNAPGAWSEVLYRFQAMVLARFLLQDTCPRLQAAHRGWMQPDLLSGIEFSMQAGVIQAAKERKSRQILAIDKKVVEIF